MELYYSLAEQGAQSNRKNFHEVGIPFFAPITVSIHNDGNERAYFPSEGEL